MSDITAPELSSADITFGYDHQAESFAASTPNGPIAWYGDTQSEHLTPASLIDEVERAGYTVTEPQQRALDALADQIRDTNGDFSIVGVNSRLFTVSPNNTIREIQPDGHYSPDGFAWGYDGNGPRQTARAILDITHGTSAATDHNRVSDFAQDVLSTLPAQHSTFEIKGSEANKAVPHISLSSQRIDHVAQHLNTLDRRPEPAPAQLTTITPTADSSLIFSYSPRTETYAATAVPNDPTHPSLEYGRQPGQTPTPESLLSQLAADGHRPQPDQLDSLADLQTDVRAVHGEHTIVGHTNPTDGTRHLHLITPTNQAHPILPTGKHSPDGYNWGFHGSGTNETAQQIADTVLGEHHVNQPALVANLRTALADVKTDHFSLNAGDAAKPSHPLDITPAAHLGMHHVKSIKSAVPTTTPQPRGPQIVL